MNHRTRPARRTTPADPTGCVCTPTVVATFRDATLVRVQLRHWARRNGCRRPVEDIDPAAYEPELGRRPGLEWAAAEGSTR